MSNLRLIQQISLILLIAAAVPATFAQRQPASVERRSIWNDPQARQRLYDRTAERYRQGLAEAYDLTPEQRDQVSARLDALKQEQAAYSERIADDMSRLQHEMSDLWRKRQAGQAVDEQKLEQVGRQMHELWQASPLLNPENMAAEVEKLLPAEQVTKGRAKWNASRQERLREWTERFGSFRDRGGLSRGGDIDPWQRFVDAFCVQFDLDDAQRSTAMSILRDLQARRDQYRSSHAPDFEAALQMEDFTLRRERMSQLMQPIDNLYDELRTRLDRVPTSQQIEAVRQRAATQPAGEPARPRAGGSPTTATRPSDMVRVPWGSPRSPGAFSSGVTRPEGR